MQSQFQDVRKNPRADGEESAKVLLVDDNRELVKVTQEVLEVHGYNVTTAFNANEALKALASIRPDIIICDVVMPDRNGFELHEEVMRNPDWCELPFIFLTGLSSVEDIRMGKALGCDEYLTKPFDPDDLVSVVKGKLNLLKHRRRMADVRLEGYRRRIIHTLSHEFRTPLVSINTGTELLLEQHKNLAEEQVSRLLESVLRGGQRLERLVDDFMLLQQIDLGHAQRTCEMYRRRTPLRVMIDTAIDCFAETLIASTPLDIEMLMPEDDVLDSLYVSVYDVQVINMLQRLLSNAHKFGGSQNAITIEFGLDSGDIYVSVMDQGPGMKIEDAGCENARQPFMQINRETYEQQGCGLGLTIAHYFTEINGGRLLLRNRTEIQGLEARVTFSLAK